MRTDLPGSMTAFTGLQTGELFFVALSRNIKVFGMKIKLGDEIAVFHMNGGEPKVVDQNTFLNRDVLKIEAPRLRLPQMREAKGGNPAFNIFGSAISSNEGTFIRAGHLNGPFDVEIGSGVASMARDHGGSIWFDEWEVVVDRNGKIEALFEHNMSPKTTQTELRM